MKDNIVLVIDIEAAEGMKDRAKAELLKVMPLIRNEKGCIQFELLQNPYDAEKFIIYEAWERRDLWKEHLASKHMIHFSSATRGVFSKFNVSEMEFAD